MRWQAERTCGCALVKCTSDLFASAGRVCVFVVCVCMPWYSLHWYASGLTSLAVSACTYLKSRGVSCSETHSRPGVNLVFHLPVEINKADEIHTYHIIFKALYITSLYRPVQVYLYIQAICQGDSDHILRSIYTNILLLVFPFVGV